MDINHRISNLISALDTNANSFADSIGVKSPVIYNIIKGRKSKPSFEVLQKILVAYSTVNANWLLQGEGEMWKPAQQSMVLDQGYESIEERISSLTLSLRTELGENPGLEELAELVRILLTENQSQKKKIEALYAKQERILEVIKTKLGLDL